jgi:hypothetical protein
MRWRVGAAWGLGLWAAAMGAGVVRGETLGEGWAWRRPVAFKQAPSDAPGENMGWMEFYANGQQRADGGDIRVTAADRTVLASKVMQVSRDNDLVRVAFATKGDGPYYVWWGNTNAEKPAKELEIKRGILLEVSRNAVAGVGAINAAAGPVMASYVMPEVDLGYNPFGETRQMLLHYSGAFRVDRAMKVQMAFTVNDMGVLTIDGKEVDRQIKVGLRGVVRQSVAVELAAGWHTLDIRQVNQQAPNMVMALAWQRPGERAFAPIPATLFAPTAHGTAGGLEKVGAGGVAATNVPDIAVEAVAEGFLPPGYYGQRYSFEALHPANFRGVVTWDFGDGQTLSGLRKANHMYLGPGVYAVRLKLEAAGAGAGGTGGGEAPGTTVRLAVKDRMYEKFPRPAEDGAATIRSVLRDYRPEKLAGEQAFRGMMFYEEAGDKDRQLAWGKAWLAGKDVIPPEDGAVFDETFLLARLQIERKDFQGAAASFKAAAGKATALETRVDLMRHEVMTLCDYVDDAGAAATEARDWLKKINGNDRTQVRTVQAALAYALMAQGDGQGAKTAVDAAAAAGGGAAPTGRGAGRGAPGTAADAYNRREIRQGVLARNVENYIQAKDLNTALSLLNQWELEFPDAIWDGFTRTLRVKAAVAEGRNLVAARMALAHARAHPDGFYAAELLYRAGVNFELGGEQQQARIVRDLLARKYPESPYARQRGS